MMNNRMTDAQKHLAAKPVLEIVEAIDQVAATFLNPESPLRHEGISLLATSYPNEMSSWIMDDLFGQLTKTRLCQLLQEELGDPLLLDTFRPRRNDKGYTRAYGPERMTHILPGNIPGIAVMSLVFALLVKSASRVKISSTAPSLVPLFLRALQQVDNDLYEAIALIPSEPKQMDESLNWANLVILYGSDQTIETLFARIPAQTKKIVYGPKFSLGMVAHEMISPVVAEAAARDIALYEQRGCLSPHIYYVEANAKTGSASTPLLFAQWVGEALEKMHPPRGFIPPDAASTVQQLRGTIPLKGGAVFPSKKGVDWTVLYDPDLSVTLSPLLRTVFIKPVENLLKIVPHLVPFRSSLQAVGIAVSPEQIPSLLDAIGSLGVSRICPIGKMQEPPLTWHHDGRFRILDLLRFVDWEGEIIKY